MVRIELGTITNTCFVVMPFEALFKAMYDQVIRPAVEDLNILCIRGDEIYSKQSIVSDIWKTLRECRFVVAELTGRNPNVLYEIGLAHAIGKPIILLTRNEDDVPFDLKGLRYTFYDINDPFWGEHLRNTLRAVVQNVLDEPGLSLHLEGIHTTLEAPRNIEKLIAAKTVKTEIRDISGNWKGSWKRFDAKIRHTGTLIITQDSDKLSATMIVTFEKDNQQTILQEALVGSISGLDVVLDGISYTYLQQGSSSSYLLDSFVLKMSDDESNLEGQFRSRRGTGEAAFQRIAGMTTR
jgi:hypothetical protein